MNLNSPIPRSVYIQVLQAALAARHYRYARQAALDWLATYPGDLAVSLAYAQALRQENRLEQAAVILQGLCRADPEYLEAADSLLVVELQAGRDGAGRDGAAARALRAALAGRAVDRAALRGPGLPGSLSAWSDALWQARQILAQGPDTASRNSTRIEDFVRQALQHAPEQALVGLTHLGWLAVQPGSSLELRLETAQEYTHRWPDCLACNLWLAEWRMQAGQDAEAVALLHQVVSRDVGGQVALRLWGRAHPYRSLWPEGLEHRLPGPLPAAVAAVLGWNQLESGVDRAGIASASPSGQPAPDRELPLSQAGLDAPPWEPEEAPLSGSLAAPNGDPLPSPLLWSAQPEPLDPLITRPASLLRRIWSPAMPDSSPAASGPVKVEVPQPVAESSEAGLPAASAVRSPASFLASKSLDPDVRAAAQDLERAAKRLRLPGVAHLDGRYPVYVIFSLHQRLADVYGQAAAALVESEMAALAQVVARRPRWGARVVLADDAANLAPLGLAPVRSGDPWELKLFLADLDTALARHSERLGALLLVGGPEIVPFHHLPNPVDDQDVDVPSDNPYACRDENYFLPTWPVGRLPGGAGRDAHLLLSQLRRICRSHAAIQSPPSGFKRAWYWLCGLWGGLSRGGQGFAGSQRPFGYTAAIWRQAAGMVFAPIGRARSLHVSPPLGVDGSPDGALDGLTQPQPGGLAGQVPNVNGRLGYFNLHGVVDAPEWFGQRDPLDASDAPDYPVALRPQDIQVSEDEQNSSRMAAVPQVVFSEACYGLHIQDRTSDQAISLRFLEAGALAVAGCTCMAYGAISAPLMAADLLGHTFWRLLQSGQPAGEALRQAKIRLATEMSRRQGYLDGEDQKTLVSFILYGDPLAQVADHLRQSKSPRADVRPLSELHTICDKAVPEDSLDSTLPPEVMASVRRVVARYLPGMSDARLTFAHARPACSGQGHACPTSQIEHRATGGGLPRPVIPPRHKGQAHSANGALPGLVTLSKQVRRADGVHPRIARLTLDERGKLMKLVVSR